MDFSILLLFSVTAFNDTHYPICFKKEQKESTEPRSWTQSGSKLCWQTRGAMSSPEWDPNQRQLTALGSLFLPAPSCMELHWGQGWWHSPESLCWDRRSSQESPRDRACSSVHVSTIYEILQNFPFQDPTAVGRTPLMPTAELCTMDVCASLDPTTSGDCLDSNHTENLQKGIQSPCL